MKSEYDFSKGQRGKFYRSDLEISSISSDGFWLKTQGEKLFVSFEDFPWFKENSEKSILHVVEQSPGHFYWPGIDVDLTEEVIRNPERFPLIS